MIHINILTRCNYRLFDQQIDLRAFKDKITFHENSIEDINWDCVIVFDGVLDKISIKVAEGALIFVAGEPPDGTVYTRKFLYQFDSTYCAHDRAFSLSNNHSAQYYNNWHFGLDASNMRYRYNFKQVRDLKPPLKIKNMSVIMSNLSYMPNHLKRMRLLTAICERFGDQIDVFGRGHNFIPYKEDAILPYRFHLCIENCAVSDLWTEKIADPILGYAVPVYAGCPNISKYFSDKSMIQLDLDDLDASLSLIEKLLDAPEPEYLRRLPFLQQDRVNLLKKFNLIHLLEAFVESRGYEVRLSVLRTIIPNEQTLTYPIENALLRARRQVFKRYFQLTSHFPSL